MKNIFPVLLLGLSVFLGLSAHAGETPVSSTLSRLKSVPLAELPGKAADLVSSAATNVQAKIAVDVVKAAIGLNPAAARAIVGSICASTPSVAAIVAATATELLPQQAAMFAQVAAAAAPKMAGEIVTAVCKVTPNAYQAIAEAVASVVPDAAKEILAGVAAARPDLKKAIDNTLALYTKAIPSVSVVLAQVSVSSSAVATLSSGEFVTAHNLPPPIPVTPVTLPTADPSLNYPVPNGSYRYENPTNRPPLGGGH